MYYVCPDYVHVIFLFWRNSFNVLWIYSRLYRSDYLWRENKYFLTTYLFFLEYTGTKISEFCSYYLHIYYLLSVWHNIIANIGTAPRVSLVYFTQIMASHSLPCFIRRAGVTSESGGSQHHITRDIRVTRVKTVTDTPNPPHPPT